MSTSGPFPPPPPGNSGNPPVVPSYQSYQMAPPSSGGAVKGLSIAALIVGIVCIPLALIPFCGILARPFGFIGLILGGVAIGMIVSNKRGKLGFPITGAALNVVALILSFVVTPMFTRAVTNGSNSFGQAIQKQLQQTVDNASRQMAAQTSLAAANRAATATTTQPADATPTDHTITRAAYGKLKDDMTLAEVNGAIGFDGKEETDMAAPFPAFGQNASTATGSTYTWSDGKGAAVGVVFRDGKLLGHTAVGLKE